jgi:ribokinase
LVTSEPAAPGERAPLQRLRPRAVVVGLAQLFLVPEGAAAYVCVGDREAERHALALPKELRGARAVLTNRSEAQQLTGTDDPEAAALALAEHVGTAVVTCGAEGAVAASDGEVFHAPAPHVEALDTTGAGDLLAAAYVWGDLQGLPLDERLRRAVMYAALSVRTATGARGAATLEELERALAELDPAIVETASAKERA